MKLITIALMLVCLSGCTTVPIGTIALCVGFCRVQIELTQPQSAAEKIGGGLGAFFADQISGNKQ